MVENPEISQTFRLENCLLLGDHINSIQLDLDNLAVGKTYRYTPMTAPQVYNLPIRFDFQPDGVRKIKERKEMTFIGMRVNSTFPFPAIKYKDAMIPLFEHSP